jgi:hypothetical protein
LFRAHVTAIITPVIDYFNSRTCDFLGSDLEIYKTASLANPLEFALAPPPGLTFIDSIRSLAYFDETALDTINAEYSTYRQLAQAFRESVDTTTTSDQEMELAQRFRQHNAGKLPATARFARYCFTLPSSSGAAERVFSILKRFFGLQQMRMTLEDIVFLSVMLKYNSKPE